MNSTQNKNSYIEKLTFAVTSFSSAWPIVISVAYLISAVFGLLYWNEYYQYLGVSFSTYLRLEDLATAVFRKPELFISTLSLVVFAYLGGQLSKNTEHGRHMMFFLFAIAFSSIPVLIFSAAKDDAAGVLVLKSNYHDITISQKLEYKIKSVVLVGIMSDYIVIYNTKTMKTTLIPKSKVSQITVSHELNIDDSRNASSLLSYIGPNMYDAKKLKYRGYEVCSHKRGGELPCIDKSGNFIKRIPTKK